MKMKYSKSEYFLFICIFIWGGFIALVLPIYLQLISLVIYPFYFHANELSKRDIMLTSLILCVGIFVGDIYYYFILWDGSTFIFYNPIKRGY